MSLPFSLEPDEGAILNDDDTLVLTNKRLVEVETNLGFFKIEKNLNEVPLHTIKVFNNEAQIFLTKDSGWREMEIYTFSGGTFSYEFNTHAEARQWADTISSLLVGHPSAQVAKAACAYEELHRKTGLEGFVSSVGEFAGSIGDGLSFKAKEMRKKNAALSAQAKAPALQGVMSFDAPMANVVPDVEAQMPVAERYVATVVSEQPDDVPEQTAAMSLDEQIEMVKSLKELLDAGILTQEEFDKKKREVMGL